MKLNYAKTIEKWGIFEVTISGPKEGNPFCDQWIKGTFCCKNEKKTVDGFYDGDGAYKVRFMPSFTDEYTFEIEASFDINAGEELPNEEALEHKRGIADGGKNAEKCAVRNMLTGSFTVTPPSADNHGPVRVAGTYYLAYEDGTPYHCIGTTCYVWNLQSDDLIAQTLETLKNSPFNKIRFCIFPKSYCYNSREPRSYPYEGTPVDGSAITEDNVWGYTPDSKGNNWDFERFNPKHFQHIEYCITELQKLGIEADIILFHPYDRWGFSTMTPEQNELYLKYTAARFSAFRNVWWAFANEYDLIKNKSIEDWERYAQIIVESDPYDHLRSIHNGNQFYDHTKSWITHCSIQRSPEGTSEWRKSYGKPIVIDEMLYEGNIQYAWGNISPQELVRRFWEALCHGGFGGHGETYIDDRAVWWSHGGELKGDSPERIAFMRKKLEEAPDGGLRPKNMEWDEICVVPEDENLADETGYHLFYNGISRPGFRYYHIDDNNIYTVDIIDTWNMTVENVGSFKGRFRIDLPTREYLAVRIKKAENGIE